MCNHESKMNRWIKSNYGPVIVVINSQSHRGLRATQCPIRFRFKYSWGTSGVEFLTLRPFVCFEIFPFLQNQTSRQHHQLDASVSIKFAYNFSRVAQTRSLSCDCFYDNWDWVVSGMGWLLVWKKAFCLFLDTRFTRKFIPQWSMPKTVRTKTPRKNRAHRKHYADSLSPNIHLEIPSAVDRACLQPSLSEWCCNSRFSGLSCQQEACIRHFQTSSMTHLEKRLTPDPLCL